MHKLKKRKDHVLMPLKEYLLQKTEVEVKKDEPKQEQKVEEKDDGPIGKCLLHPDTKIAAYCRTCDVPICTTCLLSNHDGHKKMDLETAKPISTEEYLKLLETLKESNDNFIRFQKSLNENMELTSSTIKKYFENIRNGLAEKENVLLTNLTKTHDLNNQKLEDEIKTHSVMIKKMEDEKIFVEQLKLKIDGKNVAEAMIVDKNRLLPITYSFFKNDLILNFINEDLDVQEGTKKVLFTNINSGSIPQSSIIIVDNSIKEKVEEKKVVVDDSIVGDKKEDEYSEE